MDPVEFIFDTQLLIEGEGLDEDAISDYITATIEGDSLIVAGDDELPRPASCRRCRGRR